MRDLEGREKSNEFIACICVSAIIVKFGISYQYEEISLSNNEVVELRLMGWWYVRRY
jgi:hypothetical protein